MVCADVLHAKPQTKCTSVTKHTLHTEGTAASYQHKQLSKYLRVCGHEGTRTQVTRHHTYSSLLSQASASSCRKYAPAIATRMCMRAHSASCSQPLSLSPP